MNTTLGLLCSASAGKAEHISVVAAVNTANTELKSCACIIVGPLSLIASCCVCDVLAPNAESGATDRLVLQTREPTCFWNPVTTSLPRAGK